MRKKLTTKEFIIMTKKEHGNKYDYSKVNYINNKTKVIIVCPIHGEFLQRPDSHINGKGCSKCGGNIKLTIKDFIIKARKIHGNKYDYSKVNYINSWTKVTMGCPIHGKFLQEPNSHLQGHGCQKCLGLKRLTTKEFIKKSIKIHGNKYNYSKVNYINTTTKTIIICPIHGRFMQAPAQHLSRKGCLKCGKKSLSLKLSLNTEAFIAKSIKIHGNKYDYSKVNYINSWTKVTNICPAHGRFSQMPSSHLSGHGCPICQASKGEIKVKKILDGNNQKYIKQKSFKDCINPKTKHRLKYDFYLPKQNMLIEFNGLQHYVANTHWHQNGQTLESQKYRDSIKKCYAISHGYKFLVIKYNENIEEKLKEALSI
jgi:very-short-patch-repair endonuclease